MRAKLRGGGSLQGNFCQCLFADFVLREIEPYRVGAPNDVPQVYVPGTYSYRVRRSYHFHGALVQGSCHQRGRSYPITADRGPLQGKPAGETYPRANARGCLQGNTADSIYPGTHLSYPAATR